MDIKNALCAELEKHTGLEAPVLEELLEFPPDPKMGDLALPCFQLAKTLRKAPPVIAQELQDKIQLPQGIAQMQCVGGYLNFYYDRGVFASDVMQRVLQADAWGASEMGKGKTIVIDYSSVNIAKPFHIGHLSSTAIGSALYKIHAFLGYDVVGVNHLGDWGTQFGKLIVAYKLWGDDARIEENSVMALLDLYVRFHAEAEQDESLNEQGRAWFKKIEDGDAEAMRLFHWFKEITLREAHKIYAKLDVKFDSYDGESFYNDKMQPILDELREKNLLELSEGAYVVRLDEEKLPPAIILKSDGTTLYATRDLAAADYRKRTYDFAKNLYVVAYQQNLHFKQVFAVLKKMGRAWADMCEHVAFGMVSLEDGTMSTRQGKVVLLEDVLAQAVEKTLRVIEEKNPDLQNKEQVASDVGIGAVLYSTLSQNRIKDIVFSFDKVLNFDGETGPYVQYTHARCASVLRRAPKAAAQPDFTSLQNDEAFALLKLLERFPQTVIAASEKCEPFYVTRHVTELAQAFNKFYYEHRIIGDDEPQMAARLALTQAVKNTIQSGLGLLGIRAPEQM